MSKLNMLRMRIITITVLLISFCYGAFAQKAKELAEEEINIVRLLAFNLNSKNLKEDSTYTFAIEIIPLKKDYSIKSTDKIAADIFGNLDSILSKSNFDLFQDKKGKRRLIIPVGIVVVNSGNKNQGAIVNIGNLPFSIDAMFNVADQKKRYQSIYLRPFFAIHDKVILH